MRASDNMLPRLVCISRELSNMRLLLYSFHTESRLPKLIFTKISQIFQTGPKLVGLNFYFLVGLWRAPSEAMARSGNE